jgi:hypothetical protein
MKMESALRPRDIQARIRAGESAEDVAAAAGTTLEAIMGFAGPVLAERQHVAQTALKASVRRRSGESSSAGRTLGEAAELFFGDHKLHDEDVEWDAWRGPDGRWKLVAKYAVADRPCVAELTLDLPGQYVIAENDEARILTGELAEPESRQPVGGRTVPARRLSSVPSQDELPLGDDAIELVRDPDRTPDRNLGADREPAADEPTDFADVAQPVNEPGDEPMNETADETADEPIEEPGDVPFEGLVEEPPPPPKKKSRSSVPSWDEIMFGGGKND